MSRILVTGVKGVVGTWLRTVLNQNGHSIFGVDLHHAEGEVGWQHPMSATDSGYSRCDVADFRQLERVFAKHGPFDYVYHAAAEFGRWNGEDFYEQVWRTNAIGTKNVIRLQETLGFRLIQFSSSEVYGDTSEVMTEHLLDQRPIRQMNDYALSKWVNENQVANSIAQYGTESVIVRLFNTYGPGEWYHSYRSVNAKFCYSALHGQPVTVHKGHWRTSTFIEDCVHALANICDNFKPSEVYNIGGTTYHDIETLAGIVWRLSGADPALINTAEAEIMTTKIKRVDVSKALSDLSLKETVTLEEGVRRTLDWMRQHYNLPESKQHPFKQAG